LDCEFDGSSTQQLKWGGASKVKFTVNDDQVIFGKIAIENWRQLRENAWTGVIKNKLNSTIQYNERTNRIQLFSTEDINKYLTFSCSRGDESEISNITTLKINNVKTGVNEIDRIKSLLITPVNNTIHSEAVGIDNKLQSTRNLDGQEIKFLNGIELERVKIIVEKLLETAGIDKSSWQIRVIDTKPQIENAFTYGSSIIYVYTGLIHSAKSDDELAFILGHEIGHTLLKHTKQRSDNPNAELWANIAALGESFSNSKSDKENFGLIKNTINSFFSRDHEREADAIGIYLAQKAGYDFRLGKVFFNRMLLITNKNNQDLSEAKNKLINNANAMLSNCEKQKYLYSSNIRYQNQKNAEIVNSVCNQAINFASEVNGKLSDISKEELKTELIRTHPVSEDRILSIDRYYNYLNCRVGEGDLSKIGAGYWIFKALDIKQNCS